MICIYQHPCIPYSQWGSISNLYWFLCRYVFDWDCLLSISCNCRWSYCILLFTWCCLNLLIIWYELYALISLFFILCFLFFLIDTVLQFLLNCVVTNYPVIISYLLSLYWGVSKMFIVCLPLLSLLLLW